LLSSISPIAVSLFEEEGMLDPLKFTFYSYVVRTQWGNKKMLEGISAKGAPQAITPSCEVPENRIW